MRFVQALAFMALIWWLSSRSRFAPVALPLFPHADKLLHALVFGFLALLWIRALSKPASDLQRTRDFAVAAGALTITALYGVIDEWHQSFVPGRTPDVLDVAADTAGAAVIALVWLAKSRRSASRASRLAVQAILLITSSIVLTCGCRAAPHSIDHAMLAFQAEGELIRGEPDAALELLAGGPRSGGDSRIELVRALALARSGNFAAALKACARARADGEFELETAPFQAAALVMAQEGDEGVAAAVDLLLAARGRARAIAKPSPPALVWSEKARDTADAMLAHVVSIAVNRTLVLEEWDSAMRWVDRLPREDRFKATRERVGAVVAAQRGESGARARVAILRARDPFDLRLAAAERLAAVREGDLRGAIAIQASIAPPSGRDDAMRARRQALVAAAQSGDRRAAIAAAAALGWIGETALLLQHARVSGDIDDDFARDIERDLDAIARIKLALARAHAPARANVNATANSAGGSLSELEEQLRKAAAAAGLELVAAEPTRNVPLVAELDCAAALAAMPLPPAASGSDDLPLFLARYGLLLDAVEIMGYADARLLRLAGIFRASCKVDGVTHSATVIVADEALIPGAVPLRFGAGGIAGRASSSGDRVLVLASPSRPSRANLESLRQAARAAGNEATNQKRPYGAAAAWDGELSRMLIARFFDARLDDRRAFEEVFRMELDHTLRHELGHVVDFAGLLPIEKHMDRALAILIEGGFDARRIEGRFESVAEHFANSIAINPEFAAWHGISRLDLDLRAPGAIMALAAGGDPFATSYTEAAEELASAIRARGIEGFFRYARADDLPARRSLP